MTWDDYKVVSMIICAMSIGTAIGCAIASWYLQALVALGLATVSNQLLRNLSDIVCGK